MAWADKKRETHAITEVRPEGDWYSLTFDSGWSFGLKAKHGIVPKVGDKAVQWGDGLGPVRGLAVNDHLCYYKTEDEQALENEAWLLEHKAKRLRDFLANRDKLDEQYERLPAPFRARLDRFRAKDPAFRWESEDYEAFACVEAVKIATALKTPEAVQAFAKLPYEEQQKRVKLDDGHSGNTFGGAVNLAFHYLKGESL